MANSRPTHHSLNSTILGANQPTVTTLIYGRPGILPQKRSRACLLAVIGRIEKRAAGWLCTLALHTPVAATSTRRRWVVSMLLVQLIGVGVSLLSKIALDGGMSPFVMITYRNLIAAVVVCPFCFVFEREMWKVLNWTVWAWIFANAAFGDVLAMGLYFYGLRSTSAAFSSIFQNLIPVATFIIAMVLRTENLSLRKLPGKMKLLGALLCVGGTMMVSLLRGPELHMWRTNLLRHAHDQAPANTAGAHHDMVVGTLWLCGSCVSYALYFIVQERLVKVYPSTYWMAMLTSLVGSMQSFIVGVFLVHERSEWMLKWDLKLLTVVYSGVLNTGLAFLLISWVISRSGPIYPCDVQLCVARRHHGLGLGATRHQYLHRECARDSARCDGDVCISLGKRNRGQARCDCVGSRAGAGGVGRQEDEQGVL